jgi:UDP-2,3-diacylglucosamine pyrophosphatase LpxH
MTSTVPCLDPSGLARIALGDVSRFAVISDVHVRTPDDARARLLVRTLDGLQPEVAQTLFLLGDVFDFIYTGSAFHRGHWRSVFEALKGVRKRGIKVHFCEGNHDFGFEHSLHSELKECFDTAGDVVFTLSHPVLGDVWLRHGDDVVCPPGYARFRALVKSRGFQKTAGVVPGRLTHAFFSAYARLSRTRDKYRALDPAFFRSCLGAYFKKTKVCGLGQPALFVLGHVHVNVDATCEGVRVLAGPDWFQAPQMTLVSAEGECERFWLTPDGAARAQRYPL